MPHWSIGIDFGHGETAIAEASLDDLVASAVDAIEIDNSQTLVTALGRAPDGRIVIGTKALTQTGYQDVHLGFKANPREATLDQKHLMRAFFRTLCAAIDARTGHLATARVYVGIPSGWEAAQRDYADLLTNDLTPYLEVVPESRAAMLHARESNLVSSDELAQTTLVIDIGSLTTDFTVVTDLVSEPIHDFGAQLGAALIDRAIFDYVVQATPNRSRLLAAIAHDPSHGARLEFECRRAKERFFDPANAGKRIPVYYEIDEAHDVDVKLTPDDFARILAMPLVDGRSWPTAFREAVQDAATELARLGKRPAVVLLTGGPSRMGFVQQTCREVFGAHAVRIDTTPQLAIARGLARYGRIGPRVAAFHREVDAFCQHDLPRIVREMTPDLVARVAPALAAGLTWQAVKPAMLAAKASAEWLTIEQLEDAIRRQAETWVQSDAGRATLVTEAIGPWFQSVLARVNERTVIICQRYGMDNNKLEARLTADMHGVSVAFANFDSRFLLATVTSVAAAVLAAFAIVSTVVHWPVVLLAVVVPVFGDVVEQAARRTPGMGRLRIPSDAEMDDTLRAGIPALTRRMEEFLVDPDGFAQRAQSATLGRQIERVRNTVLLAPLWKRAFGLPADDAHDSPAPRRPFLHDVEDRTIDAITESLRALALEAQRFIK